MPHDHLHPHDHKGHRHEHGHDGHDHGSGHDHGVTVAETALAATPGRPLDPGFSLLALGAGERLLGAAILSGFVWIVAWWAVSA